MKKRYYPLMVALAAVSILFLGITLLRPSEAKAPPQQYPMMDKIIQKYQTSTCEQLWLKKSEKTPPTPEEQKTITFLKSDPQMRAAFITRVAPLIANKMLDCGMDSLNVPAAERVG